MEVMDPNSLLVDDMPDTSMFYSPDDFPPLPDFPCMSSSSSSSFTRAPAKTTSSSSATSSPPLSTSSSSSSAASWAVLRSDQEADRSPQPPQLPGSMSSSASMEVVVPDQQFRGQEGDVLNSGGVDECLDVMETFGYMDLMECNDLFDPASIFNTNETTNNSLEEFQPSQEQKFQEGTESQEQYKLLTPPASAAEEQFEAAPAVVDGGEDGGGQIQGMTDEMGEVFLEWLRTNRESISAEDLRRIKIKKSTIESAARRLGGGKAAMKQLLKLILEWVQTSHLQRKRKESEASNLQFTPYVEAPPPPPFFQNPNPTFLGPATFSEPNSCYPQQQPWMGPPQVPFDQSAPLMAAQNNSFVGYMGAGDPFSSGGGGDMYTPTEYHMLDSGSTWQVPHQMAAQPHYNFVTEPAMQTPAAQAGFCGYGNGSGMYGEYQQPYYTNSNGVSPAPMTRFGSSATKEARKKRMARQRRLLSHHRGGGGGGGHHGHISSAANQIGGHQNMQMAADQQHARLGGCDLAPQNWMYWPAQAAAQPQLPPPEAMTQVHNVAMDRAPAPAMQGQNCQRQGQQDRRQGWKVENNLKFLLQKVLKQSDVGNLGRIVLPKKEAETHLPELEARDGIAIAMEDIGTSRVWNMRYRFWPNNKSRMYLLENTGDFVRTNGLQEGDFIVIYSDVKCGKYLIRGVKVRQSDGNKTDAKRLEKSQRNVQGNACSPGNAALSQRR